MPFLNVPENTLLAVCQRIAELVSLPPPDDPAGSDDPAVRLLVRAANLAVQEMLNSYEWPELLREGDITVTQPGPPPPSGDSSQTAFDLPAGFFRFIDQSQWNSSMRFPAIGPVSPQHWMTYRIFPISANLTLTWQMRQGQIWFLNAPVAPAEEHFRFMYLCQELVQDADDASIVKNLAQKNGDIFLLDPLLITLIGRVKWLEAKGFDTTAATRDAIMMWDTRVGATKGANILSLCGPRGQYPYLSTGNLPDGDTYGMPV